MREVSTLCCRFCRFRCYGIQSSGFEAACEAALRVVEGGRVPDDATVDVLARRIAGGGDEAGGADLSVYDGFLKGAVADGR